VELFVVRLGQRSVLGQAYHLQRLITVSTATRGGAVGRTEALQAGR
jgi:hypothetical protein